MNDALLIAIKEFEAARSNFQRCRMMHRPSDPVEAAKSAEEYHLADVECRKASNKLEHLKNEAAKI